MHGREGVCYRGYTGHKFGVVTLLRYMARNKPRTIADFGRKYPTSRVQVQTRKLVGAVCCRVIKTTHLTENSN